MATWQLQEAKNKFSQVVREAQTEGPQIVTQHGRETVVVMSMEEYHRLRKPQNTLLEFFQQSPLYGQEDLDFTRQDELLPVIEL